MDVGELRELNDVELTEQHDELKEELFSLRFQLATGQLDNPRLLKQVRRDIARVLTVQRERRDRRRARARAVARNPRSTRTMTDTSTTQRGERKVRQGQVVSTAMDKTVVVEIQRTTTHPLYRKIIKRTEKLLAHDETNDVNTGDRVRVAETRPLSKRKRWRVVEVIEPAK